MTRKPVLGLLASIVLCSVIFAPIASAQTLEELKEQLNALSKKIEQLEKKQAERSSRDLVVKWKGAPEFSSTDGNFKFKVRGRIFMDYGNISVSNGGTDIAGENVDATEFRTARLGVEGVLFRDIQYKFEVDFSGNDVTVKDAYLQWNLKTVSLLVGQFKVPASLEEQTSSRYITFMERGAFTDAFGLSRNIGIALGYAQDDITFKAGIFQGGNGSDAHEEGRTYAARITYGPKLGDVRIHVGASWFTRENDEGDDIIRYRQRPFAHLAANRYVNTGSFAADKDTFFGLELAGIMGPFSAQAEYSWIKADALDSSAGDASFSGGYVDLSYFITGESRGYKKGAMDRVKVKNPVNEGGMGAWQVAARYDTIDLNDEEALIMGGKQDTIVLGVNWHLNNYTRFMANYSHSDIEDSPEAVTDVDTFGLRFQVDW
ncbi:MAG: hypothetical protein COB49_03995 [Alphaproteobacteria bacterium]|nr:MAG: hypothetical protein COB49_03995 [Alphaproteobacteria bacterium]